MHWPTVAWKWSPALHRGVYHPLLLSVPAVLNTLHVSTTGKRSAVIRGRAGIGTGTTCPKPWTEEVECQADPGGRDIRTC